MLQCQRACIQQARTDPLHYIYPWMVQSAFPGTEMQLACTSNDSRLDLCFSRQAWLLVILPWTLDNICCFSAINDCRDVSSAEACFASNCSGKHQSMA